MDHSPTACERLAAHACGIRAGALPADVLQQARWLLLDNIGCILAGAATLAGQASLAGLTRLDAGAGLGSLARVPGAAGTRASPAMAAAIAGMFGNALDYDDTLYGHPGSVLGPTALVMAEQLGSTGAELLEALVAGYEVAARLGAACAPSAVQRKLVWGIGTRHAPAAAAVAARLLRLDAARTAQAIAIAAINTPVSSINKTIYSELGPTMSKNNFAMAAIAGMTGATLAEAGFTGPLDVFEGETGWWRMIGSDRWEPAPTLVAFDDVRGVLQAEFKPYPCCRFIHSALEATLALARRHALGADSIRGVRVRTFSWVTQGAFAERRPQDMPSAQFSIPYCLGVALAGHVPGAQWYAPGMLADPAVQALADKVELVPWPEADELHVEQWIAEVEIEAGSARHAQTVRYPLGHPRNPVQPADLSRKFAQLASPVLGAGAARQLEESILALGAMQDQDLHHLFELMHASPCTPAAAS